jgi:hypothetical protein
MLDCHPFDIPLPGLYRDQPGDVNIIKSTRQYEHWLGTHSQLVKLDLQLKHRRMAEAAFPFLRATFYRWMQLWPHVCPDLNRAPRVLGVGDLHIENFGTWRDIEGRLVWGVNDFDEAAELPFTNDLVRLAAGAILAIQAGHLAVKTKDLCDVVLDGYRKSLSAHGRPFVLEEENNWLREIAFSELRDPVVFWDKMEKLPRMKKGDSGQRPGRARASPAPARSGLSSCTPDCRPGKPRPGAPGGHRRMRWRQSGARSQGPGSILGSLGAFSARPGGAHVPNHHQPRRTFSRSLRAVTWTLDRPPPLAPLLPN